MEDKLENILRGVSLIPVLAQPMPGAIPCVTFHIYNEAGGLFGGGNATQEIASCQVDIWYSTKNVKEKNTIKAIKQAIINDRSCTYPIKDYIYESDKKTHHAYFNFEMIIESEE